ncbi:MAG: transglycosylase domain-containing protein, partial [Clostridia bacterium]|nr:transglycosylase domain-containing protein [Clostridia bacterium]
NISRDSERSVKRKINEIIRAYHLEYAHTKEEIFEVYMNVIPLGEGVGGVGLASYVYFDKLPSELTVTEAATIVALANAPSRYNPYNDYNACIEKRNVILGAMNSCGYISDEEYNAYIIEPIRLREREDLITEVNSWFVETVCEELIEDLIREYGYSRDAASIIVRCGGLDVYTTIDPRLQAILDNYFENTENFPSEISEGLNYSMVVCANNADLRGIVGAVGQKCANRIKSYALIPRPPASTLKPLALYAPLINSGRISWSTVFDDVPVKFSDNGDGGYSLYPKNSPDVYDGLIPAARALAYSKNTVAVRLYQALGSEVIYTHLKDDYGFKFLADRKDKDISPLALGQLTVGVTLRELTEAYTAFAADGVLRSGRSYVLCLDSSGNTLIKKDTKERRLYSEGCAAVMNQMLKGVVDYGTARKITLKYSYDTAGKTGTSAGNRDRWFVGYTPYYTSGVWCGYPKNDKEVLFYQKNQLRVWDDVMKMIHTERAPHCEATFSTNGVVKCKFCADSGELLATSCLYDPRGDRSSVGYFIKGTEPHELCQRHVLCEYDAFLGGVAVNPTFFGFIKSVALIDIPDRAFPCQITLTDAEYVYRSVGEGMAYGEYYDVPYFINTVPEGVYVGRSKNKRQYNCSNIYRS